MGPRLAVVFAVFAVSSCRIGQPPAPPPAEPPVIESFTASASRVSAGGAVTLRWRAVRATRVQLLDGAGRALVDGSSASASLEVTPEASTVYLLRVEGEGGADSAFVQVAVDAEVSDVFFAAVPSEVVSGEPVDLVYAALGATSVSIVDDRGQQLAVTGTSGVVRVAPQRSSTFTLTTVGPSPVTRSLEVTARAALDAFAVEPAAAAPGETLTFRWATRGIDTVELSEQTFGSLTAGPIDPDAGTFRWQVPTRFPADAGATGDAGTAVPDGFPLTVTLVARATTPPDTLTRTLSTVASAGVAITSFVAPEGVTAGKQLALRWGTTNATRVELLVDGRVVYSPAEGVNLISAGFLLPAPAASATWTLRAYDLRGNFAQASRTVQLVQLPQILTFTVPAAGAAPAAAQTVAWSTQNASRVTLKVAQGPVLFSTAAPARVAAGSQPLNPGNTLALVLEAQNLAGDAVTLTRTLRVVGGGSVLTFAPTITFLNADVIARYDVNGTTAVSVEGFPGAPPQAIPSGVDFVDLALVPAAEVLAFSSANDAVATFRAGSAFAYPIAGVAHDTFSVGINGFLSLGTDTATRPTESDLTLLTNTVPLVAAFWDDLVLGPTSRVLWWVDGLSEPRKLIVQWDKVRLANDAASELTFEVQLSEAGTLRIAYKTLRGTSVDVAGTSASVGLSFGPNGLRHRQVFRDGTLAEGNELLYFTSTALTGEARFRATAPPRFAFQYLTADGTRVPVVASLRFLSPNALRVTEVMSRPSPLAPEGRYVELFNPSATTAVDLDGLALVPSSTLVPYVMGPLEVAPQSFVLLGETTAAANNGGAPVDVPFATNLGVVPGDRLALSVLGSDGGSVFEVSSFTSDAGIQAGVSEQVDGSGAIDTSGRGLLCASTSTFGSVPQNGTPKAANDRCFPYRAEAIAVVYDDVSSTGTRLSLSSIDDATAAVPLAQPFPYFGATTSTVSACLNGWIFPGTTTLTTFSNRANPSTTLNPRGLIAPFWDDLALRTGDPASGLYWQRRGDHTVVQWHRISIRSATNRADVLDFQVKLFDSGVIEFHYETLQAADSATAESVKGSGATVWLEAALGNAALPLSINQPNLTPGSAWRFTPVP